MPRGYISIGSNIDKDTYIPASLKALEQHFGKLIISSIYESEPVGFSGDAFYNLVVGFDTDLDMQEVARRLRQIELDHGRTRECKKFSSRTLDLDLILYGDLIMNDGSLRIPRDEIERYAFVLEPLAEIAPTLEHPVSHKSYAELWDKFDKSDLRQRRVTPPWLSTG
ncbi:2-amino-4-hydroxy-6-hydroxymethyldihydropteridinepyrophosphokinase [Candidatus Methylobacter favarea]|uniref:2-amino-4-hydroxy-6-hydroxymethyldihydropteridine diphosphokinase n=1 Tax=Candidatus Methylobacter favarea TaxID=2707345 RepID=A0A8S0X8R9_9GAMM|nr:2-amino-4-hydroxy-6-hydroxymethyldihydropteridine diphosphokinase [Candidatus Methylobacter favarea]CAA9891442.1 2-amino-4-hydroxy-6-hydroxymethyldihydropteridinepyrophosphokinase [Candidatus Methylobacter favarea]